MGTKKDCLSLTDYNREGILALLARAAELKKGVPGTGLARPLEGRCVGMIFEKSSTRTRVSFEVGIRQLGGQAIFMSWSDVQLGRGEPLRDTARVLSRYLDAIIVRTYGHDVVEELARWATIPVINALTDLLHPCQVLGDLFTLQETGLDITTMKAAWVGDGNNMANTWITAADLLGFPLTLACPVGYDPTVDYDSANVRVTRDIRDAVRGADVISTDVWASMGQEDEIEERRKVFAGYQVNAEVVALASPNVWVLHCLPAHRGEEITEEVMESSRSLVWEEAENRLHVQKAILADLIG